MFVPNKTVSLDESILYKSAQLLSSIEGPVEIFELYKKNAKILYEISLFIDALDLLYVLGKVVIEEGVVKNA